MSDALIRLVRVKSPSCQLPECTPGVCAHPEKRCDGTLLLDYKGSDTPSNIEPVVPVQVLYDSKVPQ